MDNQDVNWSEGFINEVKEVFRDFNYGWRDLLEEKNLKSDNATIEGDKWNLSERFVSEKCDGLFPEQRFVKFIEERGTEEQDVDKTVGIVNWRCDENDIINALKGRPNKSKKRRSELFEVLNYAIKRRLDILVFPELSIPFEWFPLLLEQAGKHNIAIIGGLEYFIPRFIGVEGRKATYKSKPGNKNAYNLLFGIFPMRLRYYNSAFPIVRTKNYYSPEEVKTVTGYHLDHPRTRPSYHLVHWRKCYFSIYNCFELTNITDRALFKSKVDFITAVEFNRDTNYFSNVVESWARDLHCFILQSNPSDYGDSRIVQPTASVTKDVLRVKGGEYPLVLVGKLRISDLREYQLKAHNLQIDDKSFKPAPARYEWEFTEARINDVSVFDPPFRMEKDSQVNNDNQG